MADGDIHIDDLFNFEVARDGSRFSMVVSQSGQLLRLNFPAESLRELMMTLPGVARQSLQARHPNETVRIVYPAERIKLEESSEPNLVILTLTTPDGFEVSFGLGEKSVKALAGVDALFEKRHINPALSAGS